MFSHDQVIQWTQAQVRVHSDSVLCLGKMNESRVAIIRWEGQVEEFNMSLSNKELLGIDGEAIQFEWNIFQDFRHCRFFKRSRMICENGTSNLRNSQTRSSSCQCSTTSIGQSKKTMDFVFRIQKKSRNTRKDSRRDTGRFSVLERKRSGMELFSIHQKENGTLKWWNDSKIQVIQYSRVSGLRITVRDNSIHKGLRTRIVPAQGISWDELQNST